MNNIYVPAHETHLETQNCWVISIIRQNESDCIAVSDPHGALPEKHVMALVNTPVTGKPLPKVGVQSNIISMASLTAKGNGADDGGRVFCHESKVQSRAICNHSGL
jgi:hypothetical protein